MPDQGKVAVITGASNGFGRLTAEAFVREGYRTFATLRDSSGKNANAAKELTALGAEVVELDVTSDASVDAAAKTVLGRASHVDVLVNNAGTAFFGFTEAFTLKTAEQQFATNVFGPLRVNRAFLPAMRERKSGLVVYVSSVVGRVVFPFAGVYVASKWALEALAETASYELKPFGIDVAIVQPGAYGTNIFNSKTDADDAERVAQYAPLQEAANSFTAALGGSAQGKDNADVARAIIALAKQPAGARALRTVVGGDPVVDEFNEWIGAKQRELMTNYGLGALLPAQPAAV